MSDAVLSAVTPPVSRHDVAGQWTLIWWRFRRHKLAMAGLVVTVFIYIVAAAPGFFAVNDPSQQAARQVYHPPHPIHFFDDGAFRPHFNAMRLRRDPVTLEPTFTPDPSRKIPIAFFVRGPEYYLFGLIPTDIHLFGSSDPSVTFYPLGADRLGRCVWSRLSFGTQISMSIGLAGVVLSLVIGVLLGGISGYYGGRVDFAIQRLIEFVLSLPTIPIWLAMAAALPQNWPPTATYFMITLILSLIGWAQLARVVRGRFLSLRTEDFVMAARLDGASEKRIIFRHMLPSFTSHIVASVTLAIPAMILAETALSFLGLGLQPPVVSWGVLLREAQNIRSIASAPWLFAPGGAVVIAVLALNFLGDGLRDASDPYER
ncbi:ABC transporter permease [Muricoccus radiodurans]|uniref:ABC transporter permease n=1 Tax=Muricoccus radiodurans TaxID=2231721 RepID=UPI003CEF719E